MLNLIAADVVVAELSKSCFTHFEGGVMVMQGVI